MKTQNLYEIVLLIDFYGTLLTQKQLDNLVAYYFNDCTLNEIAQNNQVSKMAIYDSINKSKNELFEYENKLGFIKNYKNRIALYEKIKDAELKQELLKTEVIQIWNKK
ncbi:MAG: hypothetical protein HUJ42_02735 [Malacoplasma sp.]|nr:hypothetical protein [Malacoplasma sp.]